MRWKRFRCESSRPLKNAHSAYIQLQLGWGDAAHSIMEIAAREAADAIVLGRRGRGRLAGLLLGSVSLKVASLAP